MASIPPEKAQQLSELQLRVQRADELEAKQQIDAARTEYWACLQTAAHQKLPLIANQLVHIWMGLGFCDTSQKAWGKALEWYFRAEAVLLSAPALHPNPNTPEARAQAQKWTKHLPEGLNIFFQEGFAVEPHLATLYDSIALAYDNQENAVLAQNYYQLSIELHHKTGNLRQEAEVRRHQLLGYQRRGQWFELETAAEKALSLAQAIGHKPLALDIRRLLAQSQANQQRSFKTMEHLGQAVLLARELQDATLPTDEALLRDLVKMMRPNILQRGEANYLEPLLEAERILNAGNYQQDLALYERLRAEQPAILTPGLHIPVGNLDSLQQVCLVLEHFALRHFGPPTRTIQQPASGLGKLLGRKPPAVIQPIWNVGQDNMQMSSLNDAKTELIHESVPSAILSLFDPQKVLVAIAIQMEQCSIILMELRPLKGTKENVYFSVLRESVPAQSEALSDFLNSLLQRGIFRKTEAGIQYISPRSQSK